MVSERKLAANRRNAQKSTGPKTLEGKARSSRNAESHKLFCRDLVIEGESQQDFESFRQEFIRSLLPQDIMELALVDRIVIAQWKLKRLQAAEKLMLKEEMNGHYSGEKTPAGAVRSALIGSENLMNHYSVYEQRLSNQMHRCLRDLEKLRTAKEKRGALPESPYIEEDVEEDVEAVIVKNEPTAEKGEWRNPDRGTGLQPVLEAFGSDENCRFARRSHGLKTRAAEEANEKSKATHGRETHATSTP